MPRLNPLPAIVLLLLALTGCAGPLQSTSDPRVVTFESALANRFVPADQSSEVLARLHLGTHALAEPARPPINVALVVDTSGSMEGKPIADARAAALSFLGLLKDGDRLAVVAFGSESDILLPTTVLDSDAKAKAREAIGAMKAEGTTDLAGGLQAGLDQVAQNLDPKGINRVVLVGDGVPNDPSALRAIAEGARSRGIAVTTLGLGPDYDESIMGSIAQVSGGRFHYVDDSSKVAAVLEEQVLRLESVYAKSVVVDLVPGPGVQIEGVIGRPTTPSGRGVRVALGDLSKGDAKDLFVKLAVSGHRDGAPVELVDAVLSFEDGFGGGGHVERRIYLSAHATGSSATLATGRDPRVEDDAASARAAAATLEAIDAANRGDAPRAEGILDDAADAVTDAAKRNGNKDLGERAEHIRELKKSLPTPAPAAVSGDKPRPAPPKVTDHAARDRVLRAHDEAMNAF